MAIFTRGVVRSRVRALPLSGIRQVRTERRIEQVELRDAGYQSVWERVIIEVRDATEILFVSGLRHRAGENVARQLAEDLGCPRSLMQQPHGGSVTRGGVV